MLLPDAVYARTSARKAKFTREQLVSKLESPLTVVAAATCSLQESFIQPLVRASPDLRLALALEPELPKFRAGSEQGAVKRRWTS